MQIRVIFLSVLCFSFFLMQSFSTRTVTEREKIEFLIEVIQNSSDCKFIRNGKFYVPKDAAEHIAMKWKKHQDKIKTAMDFIDIVGTKSNLTQQLYLIQFQNGKTQELSVFLKSKLKAKYG
jgi:hypothetical protein